MPELGIDTWYEWIIAASVLTAAVGALSKRVRALAKFAYVVK